MADPRRLLACLRRTGLSTREAAALAGAHPFGRWWSSPAAFESLHSSMEVLDSGDFGSSSGLAGGSPRASSRGEAPKPVPAFDASVFQEILEGQDPLSRRARAGAGSGPGGGVGGGRWAGWTRRW